MSDQPTVPVIYFDHVGVYGEANGIAHIALHFVRHTASGDGKSVSQDSVPVAHLRLPPHAYHALKNALNGIDLMVTATPSLVKN